MQSIAMPRATIEYWGYLVRVRMVDGFQQLQLPLFLVFPPVSRRSLSPRHLAMRLSLAFLIFERCFL